MNYVVYTVTYLIDAFGEEEVKKIIKTFKSIPGETRNDVECFLHEKAIQFEKSSISTTHLVFKEVEDETLLVGYFSLANKKFVMHKNEYNSLSKSRRKKLFKSGSVTDIAYYMNSYLIGQLGKNFSDTIGEHKISGKELLTLAYNAVVTVSNTIRAKYVWIECEDNKKLISFYKDFGFDEIKGFISKNNMKVMIMEIDRKFRHF